MVNAASTPQKEEARLHKLLAALIARLERQAGVLERVKKGLERIEEVVRAST